jgi:spore maturation protein CgeB
VEFWGNFFQDYDKKRTLVEVCNLKFGHCPDYILIFCEVDHITGLESAQCPVIQILSVGENLEYHSLWKELCEKNKISLILSRIWSTTSFKERTKLREEGYELNTDESYYEYNIMEKIQSEVNCPVVSWAHCFDPTIFKDYGEEKTWDIGFMGRHPYHYPLRKKMLSLMIDDLRYRYKVSYSGGIPYAWGWREDMNGIRSSNRPGGNFWGDEYSRRINQCKLFVTDGSWLNVAIPKYFECMASRSLLLAPLPDNSKDLYMGDTINMVDVNRNSLKEKIEYYVENESERKKITDVGYEMVNKYHTAKIRVDELMKILKEVIA